jgi:hypothetical protein
VVLLLVVVAVAVAVVVFVAVAVAVVMVAGGVAEERGGSDGSRAVMSAGGGVVRRGVGVYVGSRFGDRTRSWKGKVDAPPPPPPSPPLVAGGTGVGLGVIVLAGGVVDDVATSTDGRGEAASLLAGD